MTVSNFEITNFIAIEVSSNCVMILITIGVIPAVSYTIQMISESKLFLILLDYKIADVSPKFDQIFLSLGSINS